MRTAGRGFPIHPEQASKMQKDKYKGKRFLHTDMPTPVSYTHLDVYKRQVEIRAFPFFAADIPQFPQCVQTGGRLKRDMPINLFRCV